MTTVERVTEGSILGEGPHWDVASQSLYFVDIPGKAIAKYTPATKKITSATLENRVSFIIPVEGKKNQFVVPQNNELLVISWDGESDKVTIVQKLGAVDTSPDNPRSFNDAKCDSSGRLWAGAHHLAEDFTKSEPLGALYSVDSKKQIKSHVDKIRCSNGLAFNEQAKKAFYIDTLEESVDQFDFDVKNGTLTNRKTWFTFAKFNIPGLPDGMTIDTDGNLWVAAVTGGRILKVDGHTPETLLDTVTIPAGQVTSAAFGGKNLDELYVTTGRIEWGGKTPTLPVNGATYRVTGTGSKGFPGVNFKLDN